MYYIYKYINAYKMYICTYKMYIYLFYLYACMSLSILEILIQFFSFLILLSIKKSNCLGIGRTSI